MSVIELPTPPLVALALTELVDCVCEQLKVNGAGDTCWCGLLPGAIPGFDYCAGECANDVCGMGWVRLVSVFPYSIFPVPVTDDRCALPLAWAVEVGAVRCMPLTEDGSPLSAQLMTEVALNQIFDARALHAAMKCCDLSIAAELYTPYGPEGGCVGGWWTAYLPLD